jgi:hypothetical protein
MYIMYCVYCMYRAIAEDNAVKKPNTTKYNFTKLIVPYMYVTLYTLCNNTTSRSMLLRSDVQIYHDSMYILWYTQYNPLGIHK